MSAIAKSRPALLDIPAIRAAYPLPGVVGAVVKLQRAGSEWKACCPLHSDRSPSFTIYSGGRRFICFGCGAEGDVLDFIQALHGVTLPIAAAMLCGGDLPTVELPALPPANDAGDRLDEVRAIWEAARPASGTLAQTYLWGRGIRIAMPDCLRFASLRYGRSGREYPVLVAAVTDRAGELQGLHRIYLADDGDGKAEVPKPKLSLGRITGGAVKLSPPAGVLTLCEGLEDAMSVIQGCGTGAWATTGTAALGKVGLPLVTHTVILAGDNDDAGRVAVAAAVASYASHGLTVRTMFPPARFKDFNEYLQEGQTA